MANTHLKTAHDYGVQKALEKCGYASLDEVRKEAVDVGVLEQPKTAAAPAGGGMDELFRQLKANLG